MHVDLHVELHDVKNRGPADSAPYFTRLAWFSFNWLDHCRKMSKVVAPRDTKPDSGRELTKNNSFQALFETKKPQTVPHQTRQAQNKPGLEIGVSDSRSRLFTKSLKLDFHSGKTVDRSILRAKTQDSPGTASTGKTPLRKREATIFSRDTGLPFCRRFSRCLRPC